MVRNIKIILVPGFSYLSFGAIIEPLNTLKRNYSQLNLEIELISITDSPIYSHSGISIKCESTFQACIKDIVKNSRTTAVFLCCGLKTPFDLSLIHI